MFRRIFKDITFSYNTSKCKEGNCFLNHVYFLSYISMCEKILTVKYEKKCSLASTSFSKMSPLFKKGNVDLYGYLFIYCCEKVTKGVVRGERDYMAQNVTTLI